jgi:hypothetical protein
MEMGLDWIPFILMSISRSILKVDIHLIWVKHLRGASQPTTTDLTITTLGMSINPTQQLILVTPITTIMETKATLKSNLPSKANKDPTPKLSSNI